MIVNADALKLPIADKVVQCCITSPPYYGLRDYGVTGQLGLEPTPEEYVANLVSVFREVWRAMKDDGTLWVNLGDSYASGGSGGYSDKSTLSGFTSQTTKGRIMNATSVQRKATDGMKHKDLIGIPWMVAFALRADGWYLRSDIIWSKPNPMPESVTDRPTKAHEYLFLLTKNAKYYYDNEAIKEDAIFAEEKRAGLGRLHYRGKREGQEGTGQENFVSIVDKRNRRTVWEIATQPTSYAHFATFPEKLVEPCILAGSRPGDLILDPFSGSGTTGRVAIRHNRRYIGTELNYQYIAEIAPKRLTVQPMLAVNHA